MVLYTKNILAPKSVTDGIRVSVMTSHNLRDEITPNPHITPDLYDEHLKALAPPPVLMNDFSSGVMSWYGFSLRYQDFLNGRKPELEDLARRAMDGDLTILAMGETIDKCHRRLLAEECKRLSEYSVKVVHL